MELIIYLKMDLALNNLQRLICHKTQQTIPIKWTHKLLNFETNFFNNISSIFFSKFMNNL